MIPLEKRGEKSLYLTITTPTTITDVGTCQIYGIYSYVFQTVILKKRIQQ